MIKNHLIVCALMLIVHSATSQSLNSYLNMPAIAPSSPDAASIEKFGNVPVDYSTGNPAISIPLWKIKCGPITWPVSISYHGGGIKVDEVASSVGLGWTLNGPGVITRTVLGRPDEESNSEPDFYSVYASHYDYLFLVKNGQADTQLDMYSYNFNGKSGKFFIKQNGAIFQQPYTTMKIVKNSPTSFTIIDESGNTYLFDKFESTTVSTTPLQNYITSWYLSKVQTPDTKQRIDFVYTAGGSSKTSTYMFSQPMGTGIKEGDGPGNTENYMYGGCGSAHFEETFTTFIEQSKTDMTTNTLKLTQINFPNGSLQFTYTNDRQDIDGSATGRIAEIGIYHQPANTLFKKYALSQSYFFYKPGAASANVRQYRLRLDAMNETAGDSYKPYTFQYNTTNMVPRENFGQDKWGYNNGLDGNPGLLQTAMVPYYNGSTYYMGNADRSVSPTKMQACLLSSITWPTGGKTVYTFEPHQYQSNFNGVTGGGAEAHATGSAAIPTAVTTFTYPADAQTARISVNISKYNYPGAYQRPNAYLKDLTTGVTVYYADNPDMDNSFVANDAITLVAGHNYELKATLYTTESNVQLDALISVNWVIPTSSAIIEKGGGLRIKEIKNYSATNTLASTETYEYVMGTPLTPVYYINKNYTEVVYQIGFYEPNWCPTPYYFYSNLCRIYYSGSTYPISIKSGSPVMYSKVTKYFKDELSADNGKQEFLYDIIRDAEAMSNEVGTIGLQLVSNDWRNGFLKSELTYKKNGANYELIKKTEHEYAEYKADVTYSLRATQRYIHSGTDPDDAPSAPARMSWYAVPINSGSKKLVKTTETNMDDGGNQAVTITENQYTNALNDFITKTINKGSDLVTNVTTMKYPTDFSATGNIYEKMKNKNIVSPVIELKQYKGTDLVTTIKNNYKDWKNDQSILRLETVEASLYGNPYETRLRYLGYSDHGNILEVKKENDQTLSYIWDLNHQLPIAQVTRAAASDIAYTSFEAEGKGNWNDFTGTITTNSSAPFPPTGKKYYSLTASNTLSKTVTNGQVYKISYWRENTSPFTITGGTAVSSVGKTINGWTYHEHTVTASSTTLTVTGTGSIDEVRLYPANAQMTSYTYEPLVGVTSQCDANNRITYYEYDGFGRLQYIRNQDNDILKRICYNYAGQPEDCKVYSNSEKNGTFTRNCSTGYTGSSVTYTVPAGTYSAPTEAEANQLAQDDIAANGQNYANSTGLCRQTWYNIAKSGTFTRNNCASGTTPTTLTYTVAAATYSSFISQADADQKAQDDINANGQSYANNNGVCQPTWYNVATSQSFTRNNCPSGTTPTTVTYTVASGAYSSFTSQADADQKAQNDVNSNGQDYANSNGICTQTWYNVAKSESFTRNNCPSGTTPTTVTYTVAAGTYSSFTSQADADKRAQYDVNKKGQEYANSNGICQQTWYSISKSQSFTRNNCPSGTNPTAVTYTVPTSAYSSLISQADADQKAQDDVNANGQAYANDKASCEVPSTYYNTEQSAAFTKGTCNKEEAGETVTYTVKANTYQSYISQKDADDQALANIKKNGQLYADRTGGCKSSNITLSFKRIIETTSATSVTIYDSKGKEIQRVVFPAKTTDNPVEIQLPYNSGGYQLLFTTGKKFYGSGYSNYSYTRFVYTMEPGEQTWYIGYGSSTSNASWGYKTDPIYFKPEEKYTISADTY